jgi:hypothetical protein
VQEVRFVGLPSDVFGPLRVRRRRDFEVVGVGFFECTDDQLVAPLAVVEHASLTSLRRAYVRAHREWGGSSEDPLPMFVSPVHPHSFDPDYANYVNSSLLVSSNGIRVVVECITHELVTRASVGRLLEPLLSRRRAALASVMPIDSSLDCAVRVEIEIATRNRSVGQALTIGDEVEKLLTAAFATGPLRPATVAELLRTGHHGALIGQPETEWLEAKSEPYRLDDYGRFLLACDIAAFANAAGGVIAVGLRTSKVRGHDVIVKAGGIRLDGFSMAKHHAVARDWIYPRPVGLRVDVGAFSDDEERGVAVIEVPQQAAALKPFFVRRGEFAGRLRTDHLALPVRVGADSGHWDLAELHSLIVAGRAALALSPHESHPTDRQPSAEAHSGPASTVDADD